MKRAFILVLLVGIALPAAAQKQPIATDSCLYTIPSNAFKRVPVFLEATLQDSSSRAILPAADLFAQSVAFRMRELLAAADSKLPDADSTVGWQTLWGEAIVTARPGAVVTWRIPDWSARADTMPRSSLRLLQTAMKDVVVNGESIVLPDGSQAPVSFGLSFVHPRVTRDGKIIPVKARQAIPVFTLLVPWEKSVELTKSPDILYPDVLRSLSMIGSVRLAFAVDKSGRVDMDTVKEVWPSEYARPKSEFRSGYEIFTRAVKRALPSARFSPAIIGGCVMKQMVEQTFDFKMKMSP
jgi:hypothetical protein